jgi:hypothetical protein
MMFAEGLYDVCRAEGLYDVRRGMVQRDCAEDCAEGLYDVCRAVSKAFSRPSNVRAHLDVFFIFLVRVHV